MRAVALLLLVLPASPTAARQSPSEDPTEAAAAVPPTAAAEARAPLPPPGEMARCKRLIDAGQYVAARVRLEPIVEQHPGWARAISLLALTYYKQNRFELANPLFARVLAADPEEVAVRPLYGWSLYSLGELDAAQAMFESLLERMPDYAPAHYALGVIHLDRDEIAAARKRFETTARLAAQQEDPQMEGRAHARLGDLFLRLDDLARARSELETALALLPDDPEALFKLSRVFQRLGDGEAAAAARQRFETARAGVARPFAGTGDPTGNVDPTIPK